MASADKPTILIHGFKTTYEKLPVRGDDPLNDVVDDKGFLLDEKGRRKMEMQREDWVSYSPLGSFAFTKNTERVRHMIPDPNRAGSDQDGTKLAFMTARWAQIQPAYDAFCQGQELPATGLALAAWPGINAEQAEVLRQVGIRSVEQVRDLSEGQLERIRLPNMRDLCNQAKLFLENTDRAEAARRDAERDVEMDGMREQLAEMKALLEQRGAPATEPEPAGDDVAALRSQLDAQGTPYEKRWGAPKLRALLAEAA